MKKISIRYRVILGFALVMIFSSIATFFLTRSISITIMQKTLKGYLIGAVEANTDKLVFFPTPLTGKEQEEDPDDIYISYKEGYLQIDDDFLGVIHHVESALYQSDGTMLYGKNPIARQTQEIAFTASRIIRTDLDKETYFIYDRKLSGEGLDELWIRGVVSMEEEKRELREIERIMVLFVPMLIAFAFVFGWLAARGILRPLQRMQQTVDRISGGKDLKKRIPNDKGRDELHKLTDTINGMLDRLEESFEMEQRFSSDVSHELRTPVSVIMAQTELTLEKERTAVEYQNALQVVRRQGERMQTLVTEMLEDTRLYQRAQEYQMVDLDFSGLVEEICEEMKLISYQEITLTREIFPGIHLQGNRMLLTRMLQNLIDNAYKYGRPQGHILVTLSVEEEICLKVTDDGIGISRENRKKIFQRFFRGDTARSNGGHSGYGLGLSMVEKIVQMHDGKIKVESREGIGSTFVILFPKNQKSRSALMGL